MAEHVKGKSHILIYRDDYRALYLVFPVEKQPLEHFIMVSWT